jgi:transposase
VEKPITFIGLDVHKDTIAVALAEAGGRREVREYGKIANTTAALQRLAGKLARGYELRFCYEAGPCGYHIQRQLTALGHDCVVVAPSLVPRKPGEHIKTDRRDAVKLAKSHRAGDLTSVWIPDRAHEAIRDLVRLRTIAMRSLRRARQQLSGFLLRQSCHYPGRTTWTKAHRRWLAGLKFEQPLHYIVLEDSITAVEEATARRDRLDREIEATLPTWSLAPVVHALRSLRGLDLIAAATLVAELGDVTRFEKPSQLMAYLGLVPSESSSGRTRRQGGITKAGNGAVRRILIEAAWSYRYPARISRALLRRQEELAKPIRDIAWKAQERLCRRHRQLMRAGKLPSIATVAVARELAGFVWAIAHEVGQNQGSEPKRGGK